MFWPNLPLRWCFLYGLGFCFTLLSVLGSASKVRNPDGVAVIIGNRSYENRDIPAVAYAHRDAQAFRTYVIEGWGLMPTTSLIYVMLRKHRWRVLLATSVGMRGNYGAT